MKYTIHLLLFILFFYSCSGPVKNSIESKPFTNTEACIFSEIAYCNNPQSLLDKYLPGWKLVWDVQALNGNHAYIATDHRQYVVAIRGSLMEFSKDAFENWIYQDLNFATQEKWEYSSDPAAKISAGSMRGFRNIIQLKDKMSGLTLVQFLKERVSADDPVIITGHSLGGNLSTVLASYLFTQFQKEGWNQPNINVITFAAPAAGNEAFANDFNKKFPQSIRVENEGDIVPKFPCASSVMALSKLYRQHPLADSVSIRYKKITVPLSTVFTTMSAAIKLSELKNGFSAFTQTNHNGTIISIPLSGNNNSNTITDWFAEAGYQHSMAQYASALGAPVITGCK